MVEMGDGAFEESSDDSRSIGSTTSGLGRTGLGCRTNSNSYCAESNGKLHSTVLTPPIFI
jgi:hypothetical protein